MQKKDFSEKIHKSTMSAYADICKPVLDSGADGCRDSCSMSGNNRARMKWVFAQDCRSQGDKILLRIIEKRDVPLKTNYYGVGQVRSGGTFLVEKAATIHSRHKKPHTSSRYIYLV